jgi:hypothetical protein
MCNLNALREKEVFALDYDGVVALLHQTEARLAEAEWIIVRLSRCNGMDALVESDDELYDRLAAFEATTVSAEEIARMSDGYGMTLQPLPRN